MVVVERKEEVSRGKVRYLGAVVSECAHLHSATPVNTGRPTSAIRSSALQVFLIDVRAVRDLVVSQLCLLAIRSSHLRAMSALILPSLCTISITLQKHPRQAILGQPESIPRIYPNHCVRRRHDAISVVNSPPADERGGNRLPTIAHLINHPLLRPRLFRLGSRW